MEKLARFTFLFALSMGTSLNADEILHRYEADVLPYEPSAGWQIFNPCNLTCAESLDDGHLVLTWSPSGGNTVNYTRIFGGAPLPPPPDPPFWVEWRFASNNTIHGSFTGDGSINIGYATALGEVEMYGDAIISADGGTFITDLPLNEFRTFRFESPDANQWCIWFDGKLFICRPNGRSEGLATHIQLYGHGESPTQTVNRWDYVRYGRVTTGEMIVSANPPAGYLDPEKYTNVDRFTVTFDQPNYVNVNDVTVELGTQARSHEGTEGDDPALALGVPMVTATRRQDNGPPQTVEIVLDQPLAAGATYRFTFNTGAATPQTVEYIMTADPHPVIPTTTTWGLVVLSLLLAIAAKLNFPALTATP